MTPREGLGSVVVIGRMDTCALMWCAPLLCRTLIAGPHVLAVIVRPYPARANAVIRPTAVPEVAAVSKREVCTVSMFSYDLSNEVMSDHDVSRRHLSRS